MTQRVWWVWLLMPVFVMAAELELIGNAVQLHGKIVAQPCVVAPGSIDQTVTMAAVGTTDLERSGNGPKVPFKIRLTGCSTVTKKNVVFTFSGTPFYRGNYIGLAFNSGSARGAGVFLSDTLAPSQAVRIGHPTPAYPLTDSNTELTFYAHVGRGVNQASGSGPLLPVVSGDFSAVTTFVVTYP